MFQLHKKPQGDAAVKKSVQKLLDHRKDLPTRLKHLRIILVTEPSEIQSIFELHYSHIYYVFFENFLLAEANMRQKGAHRAQREELDSILQIFETILTRLPDMIHERWQYNSIDHIIKRLLHPGNSLKMRREGVRFFLLWFRALRNNAREPTVLLYACLVPGFPSPTTTSPVYSGCTLESMLNPVPENQSGVSPAEVSYLVPASTGEKSTLEHTTQFFLDSLLEFMVSEARKLHWRDHESIDKLSFSFLWDMFKKFYLPHIFQDFNFETSIYHPDLSLPEPREPVNYVLNLNEKGTIDPCIEVAAGCPMLPARVSTIKWIVTFTSTALKNETKSKGASMPERAVDLEAKLPTTGNNLSGNPAQDPEASHSNTSTLTEKAPSLSSLSSLDDKLRNSSTANEEEELVHGVLYSTRENVNIVHEIFRQALMLPLTEANTMRRVIKVYQEWIQDGEVPVFMEEPDMNATSGRILDVTRGEDTSDEDAPSKNKKDAKKSTTSSASLRNTSYMRGQLNPMLDQASSSYVCAGCQTTYQLFVTNSAHVFLVEPPTDASKLVQAQVDVCKRVLNLYRHMVMHVSMDRTTWTQLLQVLLHITRIMLQDTDIPKSIRASTVAGRLAGPVFQTLIVSWIKANLFVHVSRELWDELVDVLSSLMQWKDLIVEWAKNMDTMTRVLARHVYGLELSDLPLDRLTEQKQKRNRRIPMRDRQSANQSSFSRGWSRESIPPSRGQARLRSRTSLDANQLPQANLAEKPPPSISVNMADPTRPDSLAHLGTRGRSITVLGLESSPEDDPALLGLSQDPPEHTGHISLKRGRSDNTDLSPAQAVHTMADVFGKTESLQRSSSTSDITKENGDHFADIPKVNQRKSARQRCNSGPGFREDNGEDSVHGLKTFKPEDDGITSLSSVEDTFNDMFDELIQQRLNTVNLKPQVVEGWNKQPDVISVKSQDSGSIDPNWNPWGETETLPGESAAGDGDPNQASGYRDIHDEEPTDWGACLEDSHYGPLPPHLAEQQFAPSPEETTMIDHVSMLSKEQNTSSETTSPGVSSPPYQIYKHAARDRYDSTALLLPNTGSDLRSENQERIPEEEEEEGEHSSDADAMLEKSSDDILGVHCSTPQLSIIRRGSGGVSDITSGDEENADENAPQTERTGDSLLAPAEDCSILAGGRRTGWYPDVAVALWRRLLGVLGDVNAIEDPVIHQLVFTYLLKFWAVLFKMRENLGITTDNASTPKPPELVPPMRIMSPWAFKAVMSLSDTHKGGRLHAYQLLCKTTLQNHDTRLEPDHLALFYMVLHEGLHNNDQDTTNEIVESSSPRFFSCNLPASTLLLLDFIYACHAFAASSDLSGPRVEAQTILGSILCFPNLYYDVPVLNPDEVEPQALLCNNIKEYVVRALLTSAKKEPSAPARCVALSSLGVWLFEELTAPIDEGEATPSPAATEPGFFPDPNISPVKGRHLTRQGRVNEAINVLLVSLKFNNRVVASVACSQLHLITHCIPQLLEYMPEMPARIIEVMSLTVSALLLNSDAKSSVKGRELLVSLILCICDWCMLIPLSMLIETTAPGSDKRLIRTVFKALQTGALGKPGHSAKHSYSLSDLASTDFDPYMPLDKVQEGLTGPAITVNGNTAVGAKNSKLTLPPMPTASIGIDNMVSLTASTVLSHLTNHLGHFPLARGPSVLDSLVTEQQDYGESESSADLSSKLFNSPNVQFLIYNDTCLLSVVEIPSQNEVPGIGPSAGLSTAPSDVRVIVRDVSGKFCWDSSILHGTPGVEAQTRPVPYVPLSTLDQEISKIISEHCHNYVSYVEEELERKRKVNQTPFPVHDVSLPKEQAVDKLDQVLQYIGWTSPECQDTPGHPLNIPAVTPRAIEENKLQAKALEFILKQNKSQSVNYSANVHLKTCKSRPAQPLPPSSTSSTSPFHQSRLLISECGFLSKENRRRVNLLKKNERLLRELKHLDSRHCRETHKVAVLYIAPGQEDKLSILSNTAGSEEFEQFVAGLGWEVDLKTHSGFRGKLNSDGSNGATAPYYSTSTLEVVFHVSTRFPSTNEDSRNIKLKHLGNDEVHIVWSEHTRDYRRGIIPTEFGDVLIIIYPMKHMLYRIQIKKKEEVPYFGPLFDGAIVNARTLPILIRETAINAGRAKRSQISLYQPFYAERARYLKQIIEQFKDDTTFEDYAAHLFSPSHGNKLSVTGKPPLKRPAPKPSPSPVDPQPIQPVPTPSGVAQVPVHSNGNNNNNSNKSDPIVGWGLPHLDANLRLVKEAVNKEIRHKHFREEHTGTHYTSGTQVNALRANAVNPSPNRYGAPTNLIATPRPKPSQVSSNSLSSINFAQSVTPVPQAERIHIPVAKMQVSSSSSKRSLKMNSVLTLLPPGSRNPASLNIPPPPSSPATRKSSA